MAKMTPSLYQFLTGGKPERKTTGEFMFGSDPIIGYRAWSLGAPAAESLDDFLELLADAHDAGAGNPYRHALAQTRQTVLRPVSASSSRAWLPRVQESRCLHGDHPAPQLQCECGFWALRDEEILATHLFSDTFMVPDPAAWGTVKLWGRFVEFEKGFRAQYAYPERVTLLRDDPALAQRMSDAYGIEVVCGDVPEAVKRRRAEVVETQGVDYGNVFRSAALPSMMFQPVKSKRWWQV